MNINPLYDAICAMNMEDCFPISVRWEDDLNRFEIHELFPRVAGYLAKWYAQTSFGVWETNTEERFERASEAVAKVKEWLDGE